MQFSFSDEQEEFRRVVRRFHEDRSPTSELRRLLLTGPRANYVNTVTKYGLGDLGLPLNPNVHVRK